MFLSKDQFTSEKYYNQYPSPEKFKNITLRSPSEKIYQSYIRDTPQNINNNNNEPNFLDFLYNSKYVSIDIISFSKELGAEVAVYNEKTETREVGKTPNGIGTILFPTDQCIDNQNFKLEIEGLEISFSSSCTWCCLTRPKILVKYTELGQNFQIGIITIPWKLCSYQLLLRGKNMQPKFIIQLSEYSSNCCCSGNDETIQFDILDNNQNFLGQINKDKIQTQGCCSEGDPEQQLQDNYEYQQENNRNFPGIEYEIQSQLSKEDRALIFAGIITLEIIYFQCK